MALTAQQRERKRIRHNEWVEENRAKVLANKRAYRAANKDKLAEQQRAYDQARYQARRALILAENQAWKKAHPGARSALRANAKAKRLGIEGKLAIAEFEALCARYGNRCLCCGETKPLTVDHVVPFAKSGPNVIANVQPLCYPCNRKKHAKIIDYRPAERVA